jgi:rhodanese-related sulfurtransferase
MGVGEQAARETLRFSLNAGGPDPVTRRDLRAVGRALAEFFGGRSASVGVLWPRQLDAAFLSDPRLWILDARHGYDRKFIPSLPGSHEIEWPYGTSLGNVPSDRHVLVACQAGLDAAVLAWKLRRRGVRQVSFLALGMVGWKLSGAGRAVPTRSAE